MKALIIIACVVGYLIMWVVTALVAYRNEWMEGTYNCTGLGFFWWVSLPFGCISELIYKIDEWLDRQKRLKERK